MKVLIVYTNLEQEDSDLDRTILETGIQAITSQGYEFELVRPFEYTRQFYLPEKKGDDDAISTTQFYKEARDRSYRNLLKEREKIRSSEALIFIHPIWWGGAPYPLMKWVTDVFSTPSFSIRDDGSPQGNWKHIKVAYIISTAGFSQKVNEALMTKVLLGSVDTLENKVGNENKYALQLALTLEVAGIQQIVTQVYHGTTHRNINSSLLREVETLFSQFIQTIRLNPSSTSLTRGCDDILTIPGEHRTPNEQEALIVSVGKKRSTKVQYTPTKDPASMVINDAHMKQILSSCNSSLFFNKHCAIEESPCDTQLLTARVGAEL